MHERTTSRSNHCHKRTSESPQYVTPPPLAKIAKNALQSLSTMVGENYEIHFFEIDKNALQSSTMVGENLEIHIFEIANSALYFSISLTFP